METAPSPADAPFTTAPDESWFVCHARPRCEKKFAALMQAEKMAHYLPLLEVEKDYDGRIRRSTKPLFPGYVFARVPVARKSRIYQQDLLARVLPVADEQLFLSQLEDVRVIVASGLETTLHPLLRKGVPVRITSGPLKGLEGVVDNPDHPQGIVLAVDVLQQGLLVKVPMTHLKLLPR